MRFRFLTLFLPIVILGTPLPSAVAQTSIKVIVNDEAITSYDIQQRARLITMTQRKGGATARRMAEQELIDDKLKLTEAARVRISVSDSQINGAYGNIARNVKMSQSQLSNALRRGGVNPQTLKDRLKAQLAWSQVVRRRFQAEVKVTESDVIAALRKSDKKDQNTSIEYDLKQVIVVVPKKASGGFKSKRKRESDKIRKAFNGCEQAGSVLGQYSEVVLRPVGRRLETELPENMRDSVNDTEPGRLTKPQQTGRGYEMIAVCSKREIQSDIAARTEMESELRAKEGEALSRRYLMDLRRRATIVER
ncbi:peptidylprolyl isomerase [Roseibium polysiphoniae]|uniref:Peptidylprolyl isomerase n=1 Tax=Roseibium polysiphoniae TaxID=2571221 RepID=A0A944CAZ4_9HYPH|nr:peptidylprolyl isomerase [Roseibium polysiphoniae]MBS8259160.1 peptidylprolyl isomerase [Roseibium polysiphoniae]